MTTRNELIAYALDFVSYLISQIKDIERVILFGSVAKGDFDEESDIDLFIDTKNNKLEKKISKITNDFYKTQKAKNWELKGINNHFSCLIGELDSEGWKDLKRGMLNNGIILYGKFKASGEEVNHYTLFSFSKIRPESKRVGLFRKLFGFKAEGKEYPGLAQKYNIIKLGKGSILVPVEHTLEIKKIFQKKKIWVKVYDLWSDYKIQ